MPYVSVFEDEFVSFYGVQDEIQEFAYTGKWSEFRRIDSKSPVAVFVRTWFLLLSIIIRSSTDTLVCAND